MIDRLLCGLMKSSENESPSEMIPQNYVKNFKSGSVKAKLKGWLKTFAQYRMKTERQTVSIE